MGEEIAMAQPGSLIWLWANFLRTDKNAKAYHYLT